MGQKMTLQELGSQLNKMYFHSGKGETVAMIQLFGVKYADKINNSGESKLNIARSAGIPESYASEISKSVTLSKYVSVKQGML